MDIQLICDESKDKDFAYDREDDSEGSYRYVRTILSAFIGLLINVARFKVWICIKLDFAQVQHKKD